MMKSGILTEDIRMMEMTFAQYMKACCLFSFLLEITLTILSVWEFLREFGF